MLDFHRQRAPQCGERRHAHHGRDHEPNEEAGKTQNDSPADRIEDPQAPAHCATCVTSCPACTTPMTTGLAGTSPRASNAIVPVTPS